MERNSFKLKQKFTISRGSRDSAEVLTVSIRDGEFIGLGECVPYKRYGETIKSVSKMHHLRARRRRHNNNKMNTTTNNNNEDNNNDDNNHSDTYDDDILLIECYLIDR